MHELAITRTIADTAAIGVVPDGIDVRPDRAAVGHAVLVSRPIGPHGMAVSPLAGGGGFVGRDLPQCADRQVNIVERDLPIPEVVANACAMLFLDPLYVADDGELVAFVARGRRARPGRDAVPRAGSRGTLIGEAVSDHPGMLVAKTGLGGNRVVDLPIGEPPAGRALSQLPDVGDSVALHWGWVCDRLTADQAAACDRFTERQLELTNAVM